MMDLYFWLGADAEHTLASQVVRVIPTVMIGASDGRLYRINDYGLWEWYPRENPPIVGVVRSASP